jgi:hypothetical protein
LLAVDRARVDQPGGFSRVVFIIEGGGFLCQGHLGGDRNLLLESLPDGVANPAIEEDFFEGAVQNVAIGKEAHAEDVGELEASLGIDEKEGVVQGIEQGMVFGLKGRALGEVLFLKSPDLLGSMGSFTAIPDRQKAQGHGEASRENEKRGNH